MCLKTRGFSVVSYLNITLSRLPSSLRDTQSKLRYYCLRQPDKLDRIAKYIYKRLAQDVHRRNDRHMFLAIDAINMLIGGYQGHRLVLAQVFLQMVHLLLQTNRTDLQLLATNTVCWHQAF
ncbi:uncharacterized protein DEA37_0009183 [Paragonimus westermani]|uniref:Uncharacterized protein n=1 Tax=Paragonimus westermani TaxID=34504 RepID=A0A5J4N582_9TREM|nr:uncharacterized protein DEA37_0009183 [Paragonimus westermani]